LYLAEDCTAGINELPVMEADPVPEMYDGEMEFEFEEPDWDLGLEDE